MVAYLHGMEGVESSNLFRSTPELLTSNIMLSGITYNIFLGQALDPILDWLFQKKKLRELYCFQEFPQERLPHLKSYLKGKKFDFVFCPGLEWRGKTTGELTLFDKRKLKLLETKYVNLGGKGDLGFIFMRNGFTIDATLAKSALDKTSLLTRFKYKEKEFVVANTHLIADIHNTRKLKQLRVVIDAVKDDRTALVLGDFNYPFGRGHFNLMQSHGFINSFDKINTYRLFPGIYYQNDFIFGRKCQINDIDVERVNFSDHYPVFFRLAL